VFLPDHEDEYPALADWIIATSKVQQVLDARP
jgi:hypothetical protein